MGRGATSLVALKSLSALACSKPGMNLCECVENAFPSSGICRLRVRTGPDDFRSPKSVKSSREGTPSNSSVEGGIDSSSTVEGFKVDTLVLVPVLVTAPLLELSALLDLPTGGFLSSNPRASILESRSFPWSCLKFSIVKSSSSSPMSSCEDGLLLPNALGLDIATTSEKSTLFPGCPSPSDLRYNTSADALMILSSLSWSNSCWSDPKRAPALLGFVFGSRSSPKSKPRRCTLFRMSIALLSAISTKQWVSRRLSRSSLGRRSPTKIQKESL
mmetsp:Transcript_18155/g.26292  ORF Transcript_18155/g.26292 Transcript_18155/m.26292 type:complete len:273 (-) Transcript_18155:304-1122(-)